MLLTLLLIITSAPTIITVTATHATNLFQHHCSSKMRFSWHYLLQQMQKVEYGGYEPAPNSCTIELSVANRRNSIISSKITLTKFKLQQNVPLSMTNLPIPFILSFFLKVSPTSEEFSFGRPVILLRPLRNC